MSPSPSTKIFLILFCSIFVFSIVDAAKYSASGTVYCHPNEPVKGAKVELWEWDTYRYGGKFISQK